MLQKQFLDGRSLPVVDQQKKRPDTNPAAKGQLKGNSNHGAGASAGATLT
jgi:hypothetical protein